MILSALIAMAAAVLAQHLGLAEALVDEARKIASCEMCTAFWCTLAVLLVQWHNTTTDVFAAAALSMLMAYLSHYVGLVLILMQKLYDWLWRKINAKQPK